MLEVMSTLKEGGRERERVTQTDRHRFSWLREREMFAGVTEREISLAQREGGGGGREIRQRSLHRERDRQTDRDVLGSVTDRQTDRQTDRENVRWGHREREERERFPWFRERLGNLGVSRPVNQYGYTRTNKTDIFTQRETETDIETDRDRDPLFL